MKVSRQVTYRGFRCLSLSRSNGWLPILPEETCYMLNYYYWLTESRILYFTYTYLYVYFTFEESLYCIELNCIIYCIIWKYFHMLVRFSNTNLNILEKKIKYFCLSFHSIFVIYFQVQVALSIHKYRKTNIERKPLDN